jgi:dynein heavy chain, axonemal
MRDLNERIAFFTSWIGEQLPMCWWLPAMTYPTGFLTAVLQVSARANGVSIDTLSYETPVTTSHEKSSITSYPKDGVYVSGIFIEGATWNFPNGIMEESRPMELLSLMPIIHFKPVEGKRKAAKGFYSCPLYMYPIRSGTRERPSYVVTVDLKAGKFSADFWTKRGVAMLLSNAN